ncbi:putative Glucosamine-6-phosphate isomerase protein [Naja naja]|nr:putative Glucosamine-6-phosphate isomerase protein [Naja naja]
MSAAGTGVGGAHPGSLGPALPRRILGRLLSASCNLNRMRLVILENYDLASEWAAKYICNRIIQFKPNESRYFTLGLPTDPNNAHILDGNVPDLKAECDAFEKKIEEAGGIELFVGGSSLVSRTRLKTLAMDTILANAKYFDGDLSKVPTMALTVGVGTVMDAREVMILITGAHKAFALYKAIEEGVNHMWTVSAFQQHPHTIFVCDEDATLELRVKTVKYFKGLMHVHNKLVEPLHSMKEQN